jgi:hypothetical protein
MHDILGLSEEEAERADWLAADRDRCAAALDAADKAYADYIDQLRADAVQMEGGFWMKLTAEQRADVEEWRELKRRDAVYEGPDEQLSTMDYRLPIDPGLSSFGRVSQFPGSLDRS